MIIKDWLTCMHPGFRGCRGRRGVQSSELWTSLIFSFFWFFLHSWWWLSDFLQGCQHELKQIFVRACVCVCVQKGYLYRILLQLERPHFGHSKAKVKALPGAIDTWNMAYDRASSQCFLFFFFIFHEKMSCHSFCCRLFRMRWVFPTFSISFIFFLFLVAYN